ncbi:hypothetical protein CO665_21065 [Rhizobium anhuiense]|nr:hypothetical protein CO665_21065 [Rhizobium anhuiense]
MRPVGRASLRQGKGDRLGRTLGYARRQSPLPRRKPAPAECCNLTRKDSRSTTCVSATSSSTRSRAPAALRCRPPTSTPTGFPATDGR